MTIKKMKLISIKFLAALSVAIIFSSCGSDSSEANHEIVDTMATEPVVENTQKVFYSIPSPIQLGKLLQRAGATYDRSVLSSNENASKFSTTNSKALNLGVYGADLSYSAIFSQTQETMLYLKSSKKLAEELGITGSFTVDMMNRMEKNASNKDSLLPLISEIFLNSDEALKENAQSNVSVLVLTGGFVEGLYVATRVAKSVKDNKSVVARIAELKGSLNNLVLMLSTETVDQEVVALTDDLKAIKDIYNEVAAVEADLTVKADTTKKTMTIGGKSNFSLSQDQLDRITAKAETLRAKIIKP